MKPIVCIYCEGNDSKFAVFSYENSILKILKAASIDVFTTNKSDMDAGSQLSSLESISDISIQSLDTSGIGADDHGSTVYESMINAELQGINLSQCKFIPVLTEPSLYYSITSKKTSGKSSLTTEIINEVRGSKGKKKIDSNLNNNVELADGNTLFAYLGADVPCFGMIKSLARYNGKRQYKIQSVKSAEISLSNFVAKKKKFFPDDYSLIVYIGKEYSKLIFLHGRKLKHIGSTLDVGTSNLYSYDVYFSKILLEMENGGIPNLDNIVVCGEDDSENLILSFYGTFPEANVSKLEFDSIDVTGLPENLRVSISSYSVPIAAIYEYIEEQNKEFVGINLLPKYIIEEQKLFQFAWHGFLMLPLIFAAAFFMTLQILEYDSEISALNQEINTQTNLKHQNLELLSQIESLDSKINNFDQTQTILDTLTVGAEVWTNFLRKIDGFIGTKQSLWVRSIVVGEQGAIALDGHALNKFQLTEFATIMDSATLRNIVYEPILDKDAYRYSLEFSVKGLKRQSDE